MNGNSERVNGKRERVHAEIAEVAEPLFSASPRAPRETVALFVELSALQRPGNLVRTEDDAGRHCFRADELE